MFSQPTTLKQSPIAQIAHKARSALSSGAGIWVLAIAAISISVLSLGLIMPITTMAYGKDAEALTDEQIVDVPDQIQGGAAATDCSHQWVASFDTVEHPALTHEVEHAAVYANRMACHTICNECGAVIDGEAAAHISSTGHSGYTTEVPVNESYLETPAWTEVVVDEEARTESVQTAWKCSLCGTVTPIDSSADIEGGIL